MTSPLPSPTRPTTLRERLGDWASDDGSIDSGQGLTIAPATHFSKGPRVYPTRYGAAFLGVALLTLVGCINYQLSLGYLVTFLMLGLWVGGAVSASRTLSGLGLRASAPDSAWAGQTAAFSVSVTNTSAQPRLNLRLRANRPRIAPTSFVNVPASTQMTAEVLIFAPQRGPLPLPRLRLEGRDLLGLWRGVSYPLLRAEAIIYPAPEHDAPPLPMTRAGEGGGKQRLRGQEDFTGIRPYQSGDSPRQVAWRQSARLGELQSKRFDAPASLTLKLSYAELTGLDTEARLSRLSAWVLRAGQQDARYRLELPGTVIEEGAGEAHSRRALSALAVFQLPAPETGNRPSTRKSSTRKGRA